MKFSLSCIVSEYETLAAKLLGRNMPLKDVATLFAIEDHKNRTRALQSLRVHM